MTRLITLKHSVALSAMAIAGLTAGCASTDLAAETSQPVIAATQQAALPSEAEISALVNSAIARFDTPGAAVGVVYKGKVYYSGGAGFADIPNQVPVTAQTQFRVASTTKAFTAAALAVLVDDGVLKWEDKVIDYLPEFALSDPWVTKEFTIIDLLTHRSGLGLGAGDLMLWPEPSGFTREEITYNMRFFEPASSFRSEYAYDNLLYIVAGEVVASAGRQGSANAPQSWEAFVQSRILDPLGSDCIAGSVPQNRLPETAIPYSLIDSETTEVSRNKISVKVPVWVAAGGLVCDVDGMNQWMLTQLAGGVAPNGTRIFSQAQRDMMWTSQTILRVYDSERELNGTHFKTYALGWRKRDMHGYEVISHTGTLSGFQAEVTLVPELDLGIVILNNGSNSNVRNSVTQSLLSDFMGRPKTDWVDYYGRRQDEARARAASNVEDGKENRPISGSVTYPLSRYAGEYRDPWFGRVSISEEQGQLRFQSEKMVKMVGTLYPHSGNRFTLLWDDKEFRADAYMSFETDGLGRVTGAKIAHIDDDGDWSFNFHDLNFTKVSP